MRQKWFLLVSLDNTKLSNTLLTSQLLSRSLRDDRQYLENEQGHVLDATQEMTVSQTINIDFHSPAAFGDPIRIVSRSITAGGRFASGKTEICRNETHCSLVEYGKQLYNAQRYISTGLVNPMRIRWRFRRVSVGNRTHD
ncbi:hypothetical protein BDP27DRAFT_1331488 [Rhodocollybia butyracea]|uniref:Thioesterase domain-containing protein n=1 Tax=Rhodocollybia butyracea TaxID=206335 RepID=A0A9P5PMB4_9AGAR|nr:hypothetical protein BDP27DRAFT_1331488 [Rhodocollybia butyracea]